jgi:dienelactone hydrolase
LRLLAAIIFCLVIPAYARATADGETLPKGTVVESVAVREDTSQSYALYLPAAYAPERRWPLLICFDPLARGKLPVERFRKAAEEYGMILVGSNNSRNGLDGATVSKYLSSLWADAHERFSIDDARVYAAGFSGGARLATGFASNCRGCVAGVFASGAGFSSGSPPTQPLPFALFGAVGYDDFNFGEMRELQKALDAAGSASVFETFDGGHEWPPEEVCRRALAWFRLRAMRDGPLAREEKFIDAQLASRLADAERRLAGKEYVDAYEGYLAVVRDFRGLRDVSAVADNAARLKSSSGLKSELQTEAELARRQTQAASEIRTLWTKRAEGDETPTPRQEARDRLADRRKKSALAEDSSERRLSRRVLFELLIGAYESANAAVSRRKDYEAAAADLELARAVEPKDANLAYELARVYALGGQKRPALQALEEAVGLGFKDGGRLTSDAAFASVSRESRFQKIVSTLK